MDWRRFIIQWNNENPLDRWYREKHKIGFNTQQHRETNQFDIYLEFLEELAYREYDERMEKELYQEEKLAKGEWLSAGDDIETREFEDDLFSKIDVSKINENSQIQIK